MNSLEKLFNKKLTERFVNHRLDQDRTVKTIANPPCEMPEEML